VRFGYWVLDGRGAIGETFSVYRGPRLLATIRRPVRETKPFGFAYFDLAGAVRRARAVALTLRAVDAAGNRSTLSSATG
jgi:predicted transcriptional regulator